MPLENNPFLPSILQPLVAEMWAGVRTDTNRIGVPENYDYWIDGFFPFAPRRLRAMPDLGASVFTSISPSIIFYKFTNLGSQSLCILVMSNGSVLQLNMTTFATTTILPAGTINAPSQTTVDINQWGDTYVLIVASQPNGYWVWDGSTLYTSGTLGPVITLLSGGSGYTSLPIVTAVGGRGSGATFQAQIANGQVTNVIITNPGSGYQSGDTPTIVFSGGTTSGSGASVTATLSAVTGGSGGAVSITTGNLHDPSGFYGATLHITTIGSGYSPYTNLQIINGAANPLSSFSAKVVVVGGGLSSLTGTTVAVYYANGHAPTASVVDPGYFAIVSSPSNPTIVAGGSAYSNQPGFSFTDVAGTIVQTPVFQASVSQPGGSIVGISVVSGGIFAHNTSPTIAVTDHAANASAVLAFSGSVGGVFPFGIQGNAVETYSGQVWIADGANRYTSAPGSVSDFATSDGGLSVQDNDSFLKVGYTRFIQMNGFLWMVADCSINYIGNVTTTGSPPVTNYSKQNADPEVGTIWPNTVIPWGNQLLLANSWGVFLGLGSRMQKVSDELDGIYGTVLNPAITPSVAKMTLFNRKIVFLLLPIVDPVSGAQQNKLLCWDGKKWWASTQSRVLTYIATQEINSVLTAFGTDGTSIYPLFNTASSAFTKTLQTRLWDAPGSYLVTKAASRLFGVARYNSTVSPNLIIRLDNELTDTGSPMGTTSTYTITGPTVTGNFVIPPQAIGQTGVFTGLTLQTTAADVELASLAIADEIVGYRG